MISTLSLSLILKGQEEENRRRATGYMQKREPVLAFKLLIANLFAGLLSNRFKTIVTWGLNQSLWWVKATVTLSHTYNRAYTQYEFFFYFLLFLYLLKGDKFMPGGREGINYEYKWVTE